MTDTPVWVALGAVPHTVRYLQVGPWHTRVLQAGDSGPHLVLMHGTGGQLEAYAHNIGPLAEHYRVTAFDFPGHGYTTHATSDLELTSYVEHLHGLLDALGIDVAHLNGESLGGWVAVKFAAAHPERTGRLILNTPGGTMARPEVMERIRSLSQAAADDPSDEHIRARLEWLMADPATVTEELVAIRPNHLRATRVRRVDATHPVPARPGGSAPQPRDRCRARRRAARRHGHLDIQRPLRTRRRRNGHGGKDSPRAIRIPGRRRALAPVGTA